jgi:hypothetical protein
MLLCTMRHDQIAHAGGETNRPERKGLVSNLALYCGESVGVLTEVTLLSDFGRFVKRRIDCTFTFRNRQSVSDRYRRLPYNLRFPPTLPTVQRCLLN